MSLVSNIVDFLNAVKSDINDIQNGLIPYDGATPPTTGQTVEFDGTNFVPADAGGATGQVLTLDQDVSNQELSPGVWDQSTISLTNDIAIESGASKRLLVEVGGDFSGGTSVLIGVSEPGIGTPLRTYLRDASGLIGAATSIGVSPGGKGGAFETVFEMVIINATGSEQLFSVMITPQSNNQYTVSKDSFFVAVN